MHTGPMSETKGTLSPPETNLYACRKCGQKTVECQTWESSCGGYEDLKYTCKACGHVWWIEGIDS